jgi:hypothetical protein
MPHRGPRKATPRQRVLSAWTGADIAAFERENRQSARPVGAFLPKVFSELRFDKRRSEAEIARVWNNLMDPDVVAHAQPVGLRKGTLFITVDSNVWLSELVRYRKKGIMDRLRHSFGPVLITKLSFRVG